MKIVSCVVHSLNIVSSWFNGNLIVAQATGKWRREDVGPCGLRGLCVGLNGMRWNGMSTYRIFKGGFGAIEDTFFKKREIRLISLVQH